MANSTTGLKKETAASIAVLFAPSIIIPVILFLLEKDSYVRFYAAQALLLFILTSAFSKVFLVTIILIPFSGLAWILWVILWLVMIYKAWQGDEWEVPYLGKITRNLVKKI